MCICADFRMAAVALLLLAFGVPLATANTQHRVLAGVEDAQPGTYNGINTLSWSASDLQAAIDNGTWTLPPYVGKAAALKHSNPPACSVSAFSLFWPCRFQVSRWLHSTNLYCDPQFLKGSQAYYLAQRYPLFVSSLAIPIRTLRPPLTTTSLPLTAADAIYTSLPDGRQQGNLRVDGGPGLFRWHPTLRWQRVMLLAPMRCGPRRALPSLFACLWNPNPGFDAARTQHRRPALKALPPHQVRETDIPSPVPCRSRLPDRPSASVWQRRRLLEAQPEVGLRTSGKLHPRRVLAEPRAAKLDLRISPSDSRP